MRQEIRNNLAYTAYIKLRLRYACRSPADFTLASVFNFIGLNFCLATPQVQSGIKCVGISYKM